MAKGKWGGVYPAIICPMKEDQSIDVDALARHTAAVAATPGVRGIVCNGNAGEVSLLSRAERNTVIEVVRHAAQKDVLVVTGLMADSTAEAVEQLRESGRAGADAALVFPIRDWMTHREPGSAEAFFERISHSVDLPLFVFQYPHNRGNASYPIDTLIRLGKLDTVVAIKEAIWEVARYQDEYTALREALPDLPILSANDEHILATLSIGADGVLLGYASLIPDRIVAMVEAVSRGDLASAREIDASIFPLTQTIYRRAPFSRRHTRIKSALAMMGQIPTAMVREPLLPLDQEEEAAVRQALIRVGMLASGAEG